MYGRPFKYGAVGSVTGVVLSRMAFVDHGGCQENTESNVQSLTDNRLDDDACILADCRTFDAYVLFLWDARRSSRLAARTSL